MRTAFMVLVMMFFSTACFQSTQKGDLTDKAPLNTAELVELKLHVQGMTCEGCENAVIRMVGRIEGVASTEASYIDELVTVSFEPAKTDLNQISETITKTGYKVIGVIDGD